VWPAPPAANRNVRGQVCVRHCARTISFTISRRRAFVSGTKAASWMDGREEELERRRAAVEESHRHRIGRGNKPQSHGSKARQQDKQSGGLGNTVPLPAHPCTVCNHCIVDYLSESCGICALSAGLPQNEAGAAGSVRVLFLHRFRLRSHRKAESQREACEWGVGRVKGTGQQRACKQARALHVRHRGGRAGS
jgi:hypothetical protein